MNLLCVERNGMHFRFCKFEGERTVSGWEERKDPSSRASCWLQAEIDPGEALTPVVFSFLPL